MKEWLSGRNPVYEALKAKRRHVFRLLMAKGMQEKGRLAEIVQMAAALKVRVEAVERSQLDRISPTHQGVALETSAYPYSNLADILDQARTRQEPPFVLVLDTLQDPQNLGTLFRTAEAFGVHGVLLPLRRTATVTPAVVHASSGASEHLLVAQANLAQSIQELKEADIWVIGLQGEPPAQEAAQVRLDGAVALVVGNEGEGLRPLVASSCDVLMRLPMRGQIESLNAAVAGSIGLYLAYEARRARTVG